MKNMNQLKLELRPKLAVAVLPTIFLSIFIGVFSGFYVAAFFVSNGFYILAWFLTMLMVVLVVTFFRVMNLKSRKYLFYSIEAVFYEGFLNIVQRTVPYSKITDFVLYKSVWDRIFGTGTIRLITPGQEYSWGYNKFSGIAIQYVENPDDVYKKLQAIIHKR